MDGGRSAKRVKVDNGAVDMAALRAKRGAFLDSLSRSISPPRGQPLAKSFSTQQVNTSAAIESLISDQIGGPGTNAAHVRTQADLPKPDIPHQTKYLPSPFQLSKIRDLPPADNIDTVNLHDILGDPLIKEVWIFNYCFDVDWLMQHLDTDVKDSVQVKIVHGFWKREDPRKEAIDDACDRRHNVNAIQAYLPDAFGTHHSKMFVILRHDDSAQVIIHTANMIAQDWTNMTQAVWRSPLLPLLRTKQHQQTDGNPDRGNHFKNQLLRYLRVYGGKLKSLVQQLQTYDFSHVKAALIASVPSRFKVSAHDDEVWGYEMLRRELEKIQSVSKAPKLTPHFIFQVSSIASLPKEWMEATLFSACGSRKSSTSIIFPTASDVRKSLNGYRSGGSIHTKAQTDTHLKQISAIRPHLCRWTAGSVAKSRSGRDLAAPHIKTYVRFASEPTKDDPTPDVEWALVTSANLSTQAWGSAPRLVKGEKDPTEATIHIQSYEIGVLVWPELYKHDEAYHGSTGEDCSIRIVPTFKTDKPAGTEAGKDTVVGFRMPYDLPLTPYQADELPWSPNSVHTVPDRHGRQWP